MTALVRSLASRAFSCDPTKNCNPARLSAPRIHHHIPIHRFRHAKDTIRSSIAASAVDHSEDFTEELTIQDLKAILQDTLYGSERGLSVDSDTRAEILELISQLESKNPTPSPNEALEKLSGNWKLAYTSNSELVALLALGKLPLVTVGDIYQSIDAATYTVENRIQISAPFSRTSLSAVAEFEVRSPKIVQVQFKEGQIQTPELLADFRLPSNIDILGQTIDVGPLKSVLEPLDGPLRSAVNQLGSLLSTVPDLKFDIPSSAPNASWLLTTYLDDSLRISRGDGGSVFVLVKETLLLPSPTSVAAAEVQDQEQQPPVTAGSTDGLT